MNIFKLCINNFYRAITKKSTFITLFVIIPVIVVISVIVSQNSDSVKHIALISSDINISDFQKNDLAIDVMKNEPNISQLVLGNYDAIVIDKNNNQFEIKTLLSKEFREDINYYFNNNKHNINFNTDKIIRKCGTNTVAYLLLIILGEAVFFSEFYMEDRQCGAFSRMLTSVINLKEYLFAQSIFSFILLYFPPMITLTIIKYIFNINIGLSLTQYSLLIFLMCILGIGLSLLLASLISTYNMCVSFSGGLILFLGLLSGAIIPYTINNQVLYNISELIPLKSLLTISEGLENSKSLISYSPELFLILVFVLILYILGYIITKRKSLCGNI